jgi:hypothetical protein
MLSTSLTKGVLVAAMLAGPATVITGTVFALGGPAISSPGSGRAPDRTPSPTPTGWEKGPKFSTETKCYTYGEKQVWPLWECRREGERWRYYYWTAGETISPRPPKHSPPK